MKECFPICKANLSPNNYRRGLESLRLKALNVGAGIPYSLAELCMAADQPIDEYHRHLMAWAAMRIEQLERQVH